MSFLKCKHFIHLLQAFLLLSLIVSCGRESKDESLKGHAEDSQKKRILNEKEIELVCQPQKVIELLKGGELVISRIDKEKNRLLVWNVKDREEKTSLYFPEEYYKVSQNGKYFLNRLSYRRYQLIVSSEKNMTQTIPLSFYSADNPDIDFSTDSKWLIIRYRAINTPNKDTISFFDIEKRKFLLKRISFEDVRHVKLSLDKKYLFLGVNKGRHKKIIKYDYANDKVIFETGFYSQRHFNKFELLGDMVITIDNDVYVFYDAETGKLLYKKNFRYIYDASLNNRYLLVAPDWNELAIMDSKTGEVFYQQRRLARVFSSSCQVTSSETVVCRDLWEEGKVIEWNLKTDAVRESCY